MYIFFANYGFFLQLQIHFKRATFRNSLIILHTTLTSLLDLYLFLCGVYQRNLFQKILSSSKFAHKHDIYDLLKVFTGEGLITSSGKAKISEKLTQMRLFVLFVNFLWEDSGSFDIANDSRTNCANREKPKLRF